MLASMLLVVEAVRKLLVVSAVLQAHALDYNSAVPVSEPPGRLRELMFAKPRPDGKTVQIFTIRIPRDAVEYSKSHEWDKDQVLRARVIDFKVVEVSAEKLNKP